MFTAPARPASSLPFLLARLFTASPPIMVGFILPDFLYVGFGPQANLDFAQRFCRRHRNLLFPHPAVESIPTNSEQSRNVGSRVSLHLYDRMTSTICQVENPTSLDNFINPYPARLRVPQSPSQSEVIASAGLGADPKGVLFRTAGGKTGRLAERARIGHSCLGFAPNPRRP